VVHKNLVNRIEFIVANLRRQQISSEQNLKEAFNFFDERQRGFIDIDDLRRIFGGICREATLRNIVEDADINNDGTVQQ